MVRPREPELEHLLRRAGFGASEEEVSEYTRLGLLGFNATLSRDYPVIMGVTLFYAFIIVFSNLAVDIAYGIIDPRIRASQ